MAPVPTSVISDPDLPDRCDVVIIGAGIAGIATALELAERGHQVVVCEKGIVAGEQSSRNWGWCRQMGRDPAELPLIQISMDLWRSMNKRLDDETGYNECGIAFLCESEAELADRQQWFDRYAGEHDLSSRMVSPSQAANLAPTSNIDWKGGLYTPDDGRAEPTLAVSAMARAAQRAGVKIFQNCAVRSVELQAGRISGVVTESGSVRCETIVLAGGAWSRRFCHNAGINLPQLTVVNSAMRSLPLDNDLCHSLAGKNLAIRKRLDGGYTIAHAILSMADILPDSFRLLPKFWKLAKNEWQDYRFRIGERTFQELRLNRRWTPDEISPFEKVRVLDPKPIDNMLSEAMATLKAIFPAFEQVRIAERWAGVIDVTPDIVPIISAIDTAPGFFIATGFSGHGFGLGPGAGKLMAQLVCNEAPCVDPTPFCYSRFNY